MKIAFLILINIFILFGCSSSEEPTKEQQQLKFQELLDEIGRASIKALNDDKKHVSSEAENDHILTPAMEALELVETNNEFANQYISVIKDSALFAIPDINKQSVYEKLIYIYHDYGTNGLRKYIEDASNYINAKNELLNLNSGFIHQNKTDNSQLRDDTENQSEKYEGMIDNIRLMADLIYDKKDEYKNDYIKTILSSNLFSKIEDDYKKEINSTLDYLLNTHFPQIHSTIYLSCVDKKINNQFNNEKDENKQALKKIVSNGTNINSQLVVDNTDYNYYDALLSLSHEKIDNISNMLKTINNECNNESFDYALKLNNKIDNTLLYTSYNSIMSDITFLYLDGNGVNDAVFNNWDMYIDCDPNNKEIKCTNKLPVKFIQSTTTDKELYLMSFIDTIEAIFSANRNEDVDVLMGDEEYEHLHKSNNELIKDRVFSAIDTIDDSIDVVVLVGTGGLSAPLIAEKRAVKQAAKMAFKELIKKGAKSFIKTSAKSIKKYTAKEIKEARDLILRNPRKTVKGIPEYVKNFGRECKGNVHHILPVSIITGAINEASKLDKLFGKCGVYIGNSESYYNGGGNGVCILPEPSLGRPSKINPNITAAHYNHPSYTNAVKASLNKINPHSGDACNKIEEVTNCFAKALHNLKPGQKVDSLTKPMKMWSKNSACPY